MFRQAIKYQIRCRLIRNAIYKDCAVCVFQTEDIMNWYPEKIRNKGVIILNLLKSDLPYPYVGEREHIVTNFCGFKVQKNIPLLIKAFAIFHQTHPDWKLRIYGSGDKSHFEELIDEFGIRECAEILPFSYDIHNEILKYGMFVSSSDFEGISNSMLEAMAIGLPTISTDCDGGGARTTIKDHVNGIIVPKGDEMAMAKAMAEIADNNTLAHFLAQNSIRIREDLNIDTIVERWVDIIEK